MGSENFDIGGQVVTTTNDPTACFGTNFKLVGLAGHGIQHNSRESF